jgi:hypothetical protein
MNGIATTAGSDRFKGPIRPDRDVATAYRQPTASSATTEKTVGVGMVRPRREPAFEFFHRVVELLQQLLPAPLPVVVRLGATGPYCLGHCRRLKSQFRICISRDLSEESAIELLIHEWAHALAWPRKADFLASSRLTRAQRQKPFHGAEWGEAYAKVYCAVALDIAPCVRRAFQASRQRKPRRRHSGATK